MKYTYDFYWANSMFAKADRDFNEKCAAELRKRGFTVFLPQENAHNIEKSPDEFDIFDSDTKAIRDSKMLIACIDQETIDCGVACEIGIAYSLDKYIIGLYTDIRKDRSSHKMYKNPYVIGAIKKNGVIVETLEQLVDMAMTELHKQDKLK